MKLSHFLEIFLQQSYMHVSSLQWGLSCLSMFIILKKKHDLEHGVLP